MPQATTNPPHLRIPIVAALCVISLMPASGIASEVPDAEAVLKTLKPGHPRLLIDTTKIREIQKLIEDDPIAKELFNKIRTNADKVLNEKPFIYELRDGRRLIYVSGDVLKRVQNLAIVYLISRDKKYVDRAWLELQSASEFKDWNPDHFLDTAIMTKAFAIGLDWLWNEWTPQQRQVLQRAIIENGLKPAMKVYSSGGGWPKVTNNWNQVCNGGIGLGALAVAETEPELAGKIIHNALKSIPTAMNAYSPDGAGHEGVGYWSFGTLYNILLMASLESALGTDFGLSGIDGFKQSGDYQIYLSGTKRMAFDFGDSGRTQISTPQHSWMGRNYGILRYTWFRQNALSEGQGANLWDLLWLDDSAADFSTKSMPTDKHFRKVEVASMRDSWKDGDGFIVAMQGGYNGATHRHLDLGSFILEMDGVRWIVDSGREGQTCQRHKNKTARNDFYRVRAEGHNTLVVNPDKEPDQNPKGQARFTSFVSEKYAASATLDLSDAYEKNVNSLTRSFQLKRGEHLTITDTIQCKQPSEIWSFFHTEAEVMLSKDKRTVYLKQKEKIFRMQLGLPTEAVFTLLPASPLPSSPNPSIQTPNKGRRKIAVHLTGVKDTVIAVRFDLYNDLTAGKQNGE